MGIIIKDYQMKTTYAIALLLCAASA